MKTGPSPCSSGVEHSGPELGRRPGASGCHHGDGEAEVGIVRMARSGVGLGARRLPPDCRARAALMAAEGEPPGACRVQGEVPGVCRVSRPVREKRAARHVQAHSARSVVGSHDGGMRGGVRKRVPGPRWFGRRGREGLGSAGDIQCKSCPAGRSEGTQPREELGTFLCRAEPTACGGAAPAWR